jgi:tRNA threonylcarbamoyladenosine biosynthesis protein TsaE
MESEPLLFSFDTEAALTVSAGRIAQSWQRAGHQPLVVGLSGGLGAGKTTWVRAMLTGLGYRGRVPSPTYTLVEHYLLDTLTLVHVDLYRLSSAGGSAANDDLESLGLRDWLADDRAWLLVEWPERAPTLAESLDLLIAFDLAGERRREVCLSAHSTAGSSALNGLRTESMHDSR